MASAVTDGSVLLSPLGEAKQTRAAEEASESSSRPDAAFFLKPSVGTWLHVLVVPQNCPVPVDTATVASAPVELLESQVSPIKQKQNVFDKPIASAGSEAVPRTPSEVAPVISVAPAVEVVQKQPLNATTETSVPPAAEVVQKEPLSATTADPSKAADAVRLAAAKGLKEGFEMASKAEVGPALHSESQNRAPRQASDVDPSRSAPSSSPPVNLKVSPIVPPRNEKDLPRKNVSCDPTTPSTPMTSSGQSQQRTPSTAEPSPASKFDRTPQSAGNSPPKSSSDSPAPPGRLGKQQQADVDSSVGSMLDKFFGDDRIWKKVDEEITTSKRTADGHRLQTGGASVQYKVDVPKPYPGVQYRKSKRLDDKDHRFAENGITVSGTIEDDGEWLRVGPNTFLPMRVGMVHILHPLPGQLVQALAEPAGEAENMPRRWWACCSASDVASAQSEVVVDQDGNQGRQHRR